MCNASKHAPDCNCGWGGDTRSFGGDLGGINNGTSKISEPYPYSQAYGAEVLRDVFEKQLRESETYKIECWWCTEEVYYHTNGYGDCVLLDELGLPWPVHGCWEKHRREQSEKFHTRAKTSVHLRLAILIGAVKEIKFLPDECSVAVQMGISLEQLQKGYGDLYRIDPHTRTMRVINTEQVKITRMPLKQGLKLQIVEIRKLRKIEKPKKKPRY